MFNDPVDFISLLPMPNPKPLLFFLASPKILKGSYDPGGGVLGPLKIKIKYTQW